MINRLKKWLGTRIVQSDWVYIDYWSVLHFIWGYLLYSSFYINLYMAVTVVILYEVIEPYFTGFEPEEGMDTIWDIIITISGYLASARYPLW